AAAIDVTARIGEDACPVAQAGAEEADIFVAIGEHLPAHALHQAGAPGARIGEAGAVDEFALPFETAIDKRAAILCDRGARIVGGGARLAEAQGAGTGDGAGSRGSPIIGYPLQLEAERGHRVPGAVGDALEPARNGVPDE